MARVSESKAMMTREGKQQVQRPWGRNDFGIFDKKDGSFVSTEYSEKTMDGQGQVMQGFWSVCFLLKSIKIPRILSRGMSELALHS